LIPKKTSIDREARDLYFGVVEVVTV
jgi:hypothetical protein